MIPTEKQRQTNFNSFDKEETIKLMQFVERCANGSQTVDNFENLEKVVELLRQNIFGVDLLSFDGNLKKCREKHENKHGVKRNVLKSVDAWLPGSEFVYRKGEEIVLDPNIQEQVKRIWDYSVDLVKDLWKKIRSL